MSPDALVAFLNLLLEGERAGARGLGVMGARKMEPGLRTTLREIARDEARFCAMLTRQIERLGGTPSRVTGAFYDKLGAEESLPAALHLLDRGQDWVVRKLREVLPKIADTVLHAELEEMLAVHERNIGRCAGKT
jgi:nitronate monooxygenase